MLKSYLSVILVIFIFFGCTTTPGVLQTGKDSYTMMISGQSGFVPLGGMKADAYKEANNYCQKQNKILKTTSYKSVTAGFARFPQVELNFKCIKKDEPNI